MAQISYDKGPHCVPIEWLQGWRDLPVDCQNVRVGFRVVVNDEASVLRSGKGGGVVGDFADVAVRYGREGLGGHVT